MTTALDIITKAMQKCGILSVNEAPTAQEANDALDALNAMLDSWANDSMMVYARSWESFNLTGNVGTYTIGAGQAFNTVRPIFIADAYIRNAGTDTDLSIVSDEIYTGQIMEKSTGGIPGILNYDNAYPAGTIRLWPVPSSSYSIFLLTEKPLTQFTLNQTVSLPPGWERALIFNLPAEIAGDYHQDIPDSVQRVAVSSKAAIQRSVMKNRSLDAFPQQNSTGNILTGWNN